MKLDDFLDLKTSSQSFLHRDLSGQGFIRLVRMGKNPAPTIEYGVNDGFRYQGLMSKELPKYLKFCEENGHNILCALVKEDNIPSVKLLEKNNFVFIQNFRDTRTYIWNAKLKKREAEKMIKEFLKLNT